MSVVLLKTIGLVSFALIWAGLQIATTSREPIRHAKYNELKPGLSFHASFVFIWLMVILFVVLFGFACQFNFSPKATWVISLIFAALMCYTLSSYLTNISYDDYYLRYKSPFGTRVYDWENLKKVSEWNNDAGNSIILKFQKRFWVCIPAMYHGYDELERLAYRKACQYPRP